MCLIEDIGQACHWMKKKLFALLLNDDITLASNVRCPIRWKNVVLKLNEKKMLDLLMQLIEHTHKKKQLCPF